MTMSPYGRRALRVVPLLSGLLLGACAVMRGAPVPPLPKELLDPKPSDTAFTVTRDDLLGLENATTVEDRNRLARKALVAIDLRYAAFRQALWSEDRHTGAVTSLLTLAAGVAGSLTDSAGVKNNYLALSTLLTGATQTIDSKYLYDRTTIALVTTMDASRLAVATRIQTNLNRPLETYSGYLTLRDLVDYYNAGTLADAIAQVQDRASQDKQQNQAELVRIEPLSAEQIQARRRQSTDLLAMDFGEDDRAALLTVLDELGVKDVDQHASIEALRERLIDEYQDRGTRGGDPGAVLAALQAHHLPSH